MLLESIKFIWKGPNDRNTLVTSTWSIDYILPKLPWIYRLKSSNGFWYAKLRRTYNNEIVLYIWNAEKDEPITTYHRCIYKALIFLYNYIQKDPRVNITETDKTKPFMDAEMASKI